MCENLATVFLLALLLAAPQVAQTPALRPPHVMLWAWEYSGDLRWLHPDQAGVAFLAATFYLQGNEVQFRPRMEPLQVAPGVFMMAVVRIEGFRELVPTCSLAQRRRLAGSILKVVEITGARALQIDFDASKSQREFYRALIADLREKLGPAVFLSVTALASWCEERDWLTRLGVDEAVPMLFRMGMEGQAVRQRLLANGRFPERFCAPSIGIDATGRSTPLFYRGRERIYYFPQWRLFDAPNLMPVLQELNKR